MNRKKTQCLYSDIMNNSVHNQTGFAISSRQYTENKYMVKCLTTWSLTNFSSAFLWSSLVFFVSSFGSSPLVLLLTSLQINHIRNTCFETFNKNYLVQYLEKHSERVKPTSKLYSTCFLAKLYMCTRWWFKYYHTHF